MVCTQLISSLVAPMPDWICTSDEATIWSSDGKGSYTVAPAAVDEAPARGTVVELVYRGKVLRAPVVDRGPFTRGIRYDLTRATAKDLGFRQTDTVGAAQVGAPQPSR